MNRSDNNDSTWSGEEEQSSIVLLIATDNLGRLIGREGRNIKRLQSETHTKLEISKDSFDGMTEVTITGNADGIKNAELKIVNQFELPNCDRSTRPSNYSSNSNSQGRQRNPFGGRDAPAGNNYGRSVYRSSVPQAAPSHQPPIEIYDFKAISEECDLLSTKYWAKFPEIKKIFYEELPEVANMSQIDVELFRERNNNIMVERPLGQVECKSIPNPVSNFHQAFHNYPAILDLIKKAGFEKPSPIQSQSWPIVMSGLDLIGIAQTGTGKTLAFLLPALIHIDSQVELRETWGRPTALVLAPTRELALQIEKEANKYNFKNLKALCIYGGVSREEQIAKLKPGIDIIIATPGRLDDFVIAGYINPDTITYVVLDEADRMLDMGFEPQIRKTLYKIRPDRQTIMTSATWPSGVRRLAQSYMKNPYQVYVGSLDLVAVHSVAQSIVILENDEDLKFEKFIEYIRDIKPDQKILVFVGKKAKASFLSTELSCMGIECSCIHGDLEQMDREQAIADMMDNTSKILIATDIVSRGIDIQDVTHVLNYDFPRNIEEYVHRVGRTGRAGKTGESISFFTWSDARHATELIKILDEASQDIPLALKNMEARYIKGAARREQFKRKY